MCYISPQYPSARWHRGHKGTAATRAAPARRTRGQPLCAWLPARQQMISQKKAALKCKPRGSGFNRGRKKSESQTGGKTKEKERVKGDRLFELSLSSCHRERFHGPRPFPTLRPPSMENGSTRARLFGPKTLLVLCGKCSLTTVPGTPFIPANKTWSEL